ncbi:MAG: DUF4956 domain-containing protein [Clostridia bacterium]|nr:DUF4956 domain-containing protein [Clostridia bacterium]MBR4054565.1 DUF4956 domain-containing protein [Clostridia bacterium]
MSFADMFKNSILEGFNTDVTMGKVVAGLLAALLAALFILFIYRMTMRGIAANRGYEITLLLVTAISAMIVLTITSNLALSLGMVGALSIIRFRTAIKEASDTAFMFWAVAAGITAGAGFYMITLVGCLFIGFVTVVACLLTRKSARPYLLVVRTEAGDTAELVEKLLNENHVRRKLSSMVQNDRYTEVIYEISMSAAQQRLAAAVKALPGVKTVSLVDCRNS